jgi:DNA mismatch endonuclease (patch repair protein)
MDTMNKAARSGLMSRIRSEGTGPELLVEAAVRRLRLRFETHARDLPGRPDLVLRRRKVAVFVHGCFWHRHEGCAKSRTPKSNVGFWTAKLDANVRRDKRAARRLRADGWRVLTVWECGAGDRAAVERKLRRATCA